MNGPHYSDHLQHLATLRSAVLRAVDPAALVRQFLTPADFGAAGRIFVVGAGKAGVAMTTAAAEIIGPRLTRAVVAVPHRPGQFLDRVTFLEGGHPVPTEGSLAAGRAVAELLQGLSAADLVVALI